MQVCAAVVAVQLGMLKEAEQLYASCGRHDLLNTLYQASGQWEKALEIAEKEDRIHLKATHYTYARQLEAEGETMKAAEHFERSDTHRVEVPRRLFDSRMPLHASAHHDALSPLPTGADGLARARVSHAAAPLALSPSPDASQADPGRRSCLHEPGQAVWHLPSQGECR
jgi:hypothetical protein